MTNALPDTGRNEALDFAKGALVVFMSIYHAMNILSNAGPEDFQYIRFVSGAFIFLSGYVVARFYRPRFALDRLGAAKRLAWRGCKLALLFTALNLLIHLSGIGNPEKLHKAAASPSLGDLVAVYVFGDSGLVSFQILLPIAYVLMASPILLLAGERKTGAWGLLAAGFACLLLPFESPHWQFTVLGAVGLAVGQTEQISSKPLPSAGPTLAVFALAACIAAMGFLSRHPVGYALGTALVVKLLHDFGKADALPRHSTEALILLGRYSLPCYIAQIAVLRLISAGLAGAKLSLGFGLMALTALATVWLIAMCIALDLLRRRYPLVRSSYRLIFS